MKQRCRDKQDKSDDIGTSYINIGGQALAYIEITAELEQLPERQNYLCTNNKQDLQSNKRW